MKPKAWEQVSENVLSANYLSIFTKRPEKHFPDIIQESNSQL